MINLRQYQVEALDKLRHSLARGNKRVMLYSPTGSGKTEIGMAMVRAALAKCRKVAFIANRKELVRQTSRRFNKAGIQHGIVQAENTVDIRADVLICSIDTVYVRGLPDDIDLIIIDEAHAVAGSKKYRELLFKYNAVPVIGLSATPFAVGLGRHYGVLGGALFQEMVEATTIRELIDLGFLVDVDIFAPSTPDLSGVATRKGKDGEVDYAETQLAEAVDKPELVGDVVQHWFRLARGKATVVFATSIAHSKHIVEQFQAAGVSAAHLDCYCDDEARADILTRFNAGEITVLSNVAILAEGWDAPHTECMILARPTKSLTRFIQMVGRVLRPFDGKTKALLLDHSGSTERLGYPTDDLPLELDDGKPNSAGMKLAKERLPTACPFCSYMRPPGAHACPECGLAPERQSDVEVEAGELVKLERGKAKASRAEKQATYSGLRWIAAERGRQPGWVAHIFRDRFGVWPRGLDDTPAPPSEALIRWVRSRQIRYAKGREAHNAS